MLALLLNNLKAIGAVIITLFLAYWLHNWRVDRIEKKHVKALAEQAVYLEEDCKKQQKITEGVANDYQNKISALNSQLLKYKRLYNAKRNELPASNPSSSNNAATGREYAGQDGSNAGSFLDFGGQCEGIRIQLTSCQDFIKQTWELRN